MQTRTACAEWPVVCFQCFWGMLLYPACNNDSQFLGLSQTSIILPWWCSLGSSFIAFLARVGGGGVRDMRAVLNLFVPPPQPPPSTTPHELHHSGIRTSKEHKKFLHLFHPTEVPRMLLNYTYRPCTVIAFFSLIDLNVGVLFCFYLTLLIYECVFF